MATQKNADKGVNRDKWAGGKFVPVNPKYLDLVNTPKKPAKKEKK